MTQTRTCVFAPHALRNIPKDANVIRKLLPDDSYTLPIGPVEISAKLTGPPKQRLVAFNFPSLDCCLIEREIPQRSHQQDEEGEEGQEVCGV